MNFNKDLFFQIYNLAYKNPTLDAFMIFGADYLIFIVCILIIFFFIRGGNKEKKSAILAFFGFVIAFIIINIIRIFISEPRPFITYPISTLIKDVGGYSFPSVHSTLISTIAFAYIYFKSKLWPFFLFSTFLIGFARIFVGVHYPLDILGGFLVGFISTLLTTTILKIFSKP